jgi:hypothetical protein
MERVRRVVDIRDVVASRAVRREGSDGMVWEWSAVCVEIQKICCVMSGGDKLMWEK